MTTAWDSLLKDVVTLLSIPEEWLTKKNKTYQVKWDTRCRSTTGQPKHPRILGDKCKPMFTFALQDAGALRAPGEVCLDVHPRARNSGLRDSDASSPVSHLRPKPIPAAMLGYTSLFHLFHGVDRRPPEKESILGIWNFCRNPVG